VLWDDHPLSIYARAEQTYVDGIKYYDLEEDQAKREWMREERARLVQAMKTAAKGGGRTPSERMHSHYHCDTLTDENR
jgi:hypothetical protein